MPAIAIAIARLMSRPGALLPLLALLGCSSAAAPVTTIGFEAVTMPASGYIDAAAARMGHVVGGVTFATAYDEKYMTSSGVTLSSLTDTKTAGYKNAYSAFPGSGAGGSKIFAVLYPIGPTKPLVIFPSDVKPRSVAVANTTYAALSMQNGDQFARKFSAASKDFFTVEFTGYDANDQPTTVVQHDLADFRPSPPEGIQGGWVTVDLSALGKVRKINVDFQSSDVGTYGINTPLYVAIDDLGFEQ